MATYIPPPRIENERYPNEVPFDYDMSIDQSYWEAEAEIEKWSDFVAELKQKKQ